MALICQDQPADPLMSEVELEEALCAKHTQLWDKWLDAVDTGELGEFCDLFVAPRATWTSERLFVNERVVGKPAWVRHYNRVYQYAWGGAGLIAQFEMTRRRVNTSTRTVSFNIHMTILLPSNQKLRTRHRHAEWGFTSNLKLDSYHIEPLSTFDLLPTVPASYERPCVHNCWDSVRVKRSWCLLRCRVCQSQWRVPPKSFTKCARYTSKAGCADGVACQLIHLNVKKQTATERLRAMDFADHPEFIFRACTTAFSGSVPRKMIRPGISPSASRSRAASAAATVKAAQVRRRTRSQPLPRVWRS